MSEDKIVLIKKTKPAWQAGRYNFVGGKIEEGEEPIDCMIREFQEETGVETDFTEWKHLGKMFRVGDFEMFVYYIDSPKVLSARTKTEEHVDIFDLEEGFLVEFASNPQFFMSNLAMMYHFAISQDFKDYGCQFAIEYPSNSL